MARPDEIDALLAERAGKIFVELAPGRGSIPVLAVQAASLAEAWESSMLALYAYGCEIRTEYDQKDDRGNFIDPPSLDCSMRMIVAEPGSEPGIHRCFPGGLDALEEYRQEVLDGIKDHWCRNPEDPDDQRWEYTYHERMTNYRLPGQISGIDQIEALAQGLAKSPHSRRQQAIIWKVWEDTGIHDPACMQSLWFRILEDENGAPRLNMNVRFRSRDAYDAAFMNCFALVRLQEKVAARISELSGKEIKLGRYVDESDSYHIYGHRIEDFKTRFIKQVQSRDLEDRTWTLEFAEPLFEEARPRIAEKIKQHDREGG